MQQFLLLQQDLPEEPLANPPSTMQGPIHVLKVHTHTMGSWGLVPSFEFCWSISISETPASYAVLSD